MDKSKLIKAFQEKWIKEHHVYEDTSGSMSYPEIIGFIRNFKSESEEECDGCRWQGCDGNEYEFDKLVIVCDLCKRKGLELEDYYDPKK